jgi:hypothetical protein
MLTTTGLALYPLIAAAVVLGGVYVIPPRWCTLSFAGVVSSLLCFLALRRWAASEAPGSLSGGEAFGAYLVGLAVALLVYWLWPAKTQPAEH